MEAVKDALVDEFERAIHEFCGYVSELTDDALDTPVPGEEGSVRAILAHVIDAAHGHVSGVARSCGRDEAPRPPPRTDQLDGIESFVRALQDVVRFTRESLADVRDEELAAMRFEARWGQTYDGEQLLEHAICHPGRHRRQLRRFFAGELR